MDIDFFRPDYETEWNSSNLDAGRAIALAKGFKPDAFFQALGIYNKYKDAFLGKGFPRRGCSDRGAMEQDDYDVWSNFRDFCDSNTYLDGESSYEAVFAYFHKAVDAGYWNGNKQDFLWKLYIEALPSKWGLGKYPHPDFVEFLKSKGEWPDKFDHYKDPDQYRLDVTTFDPATIDTREKAIAALFDLCPEYFARVRAIQARYAEFKEISDEERFFLVCYIEALGQALYGSVRTAIDVTAPESSLWEWTRYRDQTKPEWNGDVKSYFQALYDYGVIFPETSEKLIARLFPDGLAYSETSFVLKYYASLVSDGSLTLDEAVKLFIGKELKGISLFDCRFNVEMRIGRGGPDLLSVIDPPEEWHYRNDAEGQYKSLAEKLEKDCLKQGGIRPIGQNSAGANLFDPKAITNWLQDVTGQEPMPVLKQALDSLPQVTFVVDETLRGDLNYFAGGVTNIVKEYAENKPAKKTETRGRKRGDGKIDNSFYIKQAKKLMDKGQAKSKRDAILQLINNGTIPLNNAQEESVVTRISKEMR